MNTNVFFSKVALNHISEKRDIKAFLLGDKNLSSKHLASFHDISNSFIQEKHIFTKKLGFICLTR